MNHSMPGLPVHHQLPEFPEFRLTSIESVMPSSHLILCCPLHLLPPIPPSIRVFSSQSTLRMRWPKYWSFSFSIIPSKKHPGLISFRMDWLDLLEVQGTLKSLLQHHSSKASVLRRSAFFTVQLSHPYMTTGKTIALTRRTFVGKVMALLFNMLSAAASLQSCPTLCNPIDGSPPGSPVPGILHARTLEWVAISFSNAWKWKGKVKLLSHVWPLATPWTAAYQAPLSMEVFRQENWSGVPLPSPRLVINFQIYNIVLLTIVTMLYIASPWLIYLMEDSKSNFDKNLQRMNNFKDIL